MRTTTRQAVLAYIIANPGSTTSTIVAATHLDKRNVEKALDNLRNAHEIFNSNGGRRPATYTAEPPRMTQPVNGPGHTMRPLGKLDAPASSPLRNSTTNSNYDGAELRPYEGRTDANTHMQHGSVVGGVWQPYKAPGLMCVGAAGPVSTGSPGRRFAA